MTSTTIRIDDRYHGFPGLAMGGIAGGRLARRIGTETEVEVTFQRPIPTDDDLELAETDDAVELWTGDEIAATATSTSIDVDVPDPVSWENAAAASRSYRGHQTHPYPSCFTCGPDRPEGDGLRVFPAPVEDGNLVAAAWTPHPDLGETDGTLPLEYVWAAVDCSSIWPVVEAAPPDSPAHVVTGRLAVRFDEPVRSGEPHVGMAWPETRRDGKRLAAAVILDRAGSVKALARHVLVVTDWRVPLGVAGWSDGV